MSVVKRVQSYVKHNRRRVAMVVGAVVLLIIVSGRFAGGDQTTANTDVQLPKVAVSPLNEFVQSDATVEGTGEVESIAQVELRSEVAARVTSIPTAIGSDVVEGQALATFSNADLVAQRSQAFAQVEAAQAGLLQFEASLQSQEARLAQIKKGPRLVDINVAQANLARAEQGAIDAQAALDAAAEQNDIALANAYQDVSDTIRTGYASVSNAVNNQIGGFFEEETINNLYNPSLSFSVAVTAMRTDIERQRIQVEQALEDYNDLIEELPADNEETLDQLLTRAINNVAVMQRFFDALGPVVEEAIVDETTRATYRSSVFAARSAVNGAAVSVNNQDQTIELQKRANDSALIAAQSRANDASQALVAANEQLSATAEGASVEQLDQQEAAVRQAEAALRSQRAQVASAQAQVAVINAQIAKTAIRSPIAGTVATLPVRIGELVSPGTLVASVVNTEAFQIKTFIDSSDLSLVRTGGQAMINGSVTGTVSNISPSIDPDTKKVEVTVVIDNNDGSLVAGQFVTVAIEPDAEMLAAGPQAILPLQSVYVTQSGQFVFIVDENSTIQTVPVELGRVRGTSVEVLTGLDNIDGIVTSVRGLEPGQAVERI